METVLCQKLIRLSCAKLVVARTSHDGLRKSLHVLAVLRHAHEPGARFLPECSSLLSSRRSSFTSTSTTPTSSDLLVPQQPPTHSEPPVEEVVECEGDNDGSSMARKRRPSDAAVLPHQKRHCDNC